MFEKEHKKHTLLEGCHHRVALVIEYNGAALHGWQKQSSPAVSTVQGLLENAIQKVADAPVKLYCAGRTDAGVHATGQVAHFDVSIDRGEKAWVMGVNSNLPATIRVRKAYTVDEFFHARHTAVFRRYEYWIENTAVASAIRAGQVTWFRRALNVELMHEQAQALLGENDFSSFQAAACQSATAMRDMQEIAVARHGDKVCVTVQANAFLLHMVRNIVGALLTVGTGERADGYIAELLAAKDRTLAPATAKPDGLYLVNVGYNFSFEGSDWDSPEGVLY